MGRDTLHVSAKVSACLHPHTLHSLVFLQMTRCCFCLILTAPCVSAPHIPMPAQERCSTSVCSCRFFWWISSSIQACYFHFFFFLRKTLWLEVSPMSSFSFTAKTMGRLLHAPCLQFLSSHTVTNPLPKHGQPQLTPSHRDYQWLSSCKSNGRFSVPTLPDLQPAASVRHIRSLSPSRNMHKACCPGAAPYVPLLTPRLYCWASSLTSPLCWPVLDLFSSACSWKPHSSLFLRLSDFYLQTKSLPRFLNPTAHSTYLLKCLTGTSNWTYRKNNTPPLQICNRLPSPSQFVVTPFLQLLKHKRRRQFFLSHAPPTSTSPIHSTIKIHPEFGCFSPPPSLRSCSSNHQVNYCNSVLLGFHTLVS